MTEWVLDGFDVKARKSNRVLRGGDWFSYANFARSALRINRTATTANFSNSFRPARARLQSSEAGSR
jgi:formylglycine-generating enzyme required for sulfatase activity